MPLFVSSLKLHLRREGLYTELGLTGGSADYGMMHTAGVKTRKTDNDDRVADIAKGAFELGVGMIAVLLFIWCVISGFSYKAIYRKEYFRRVEAGEEYSSIYDFYVRNPWFIALPTVRGACIYFAFTLFFALCIALIATK